VKLDRPVSGDPTVLRQVFENLFANALQHGGPSVTVTIGELRMLTVPVDGSEGDEPALVGFYVADDGPGIPAELREDLFEMGVSGAGGTGYGLAIVRQFAVDHGWTVSATRSADGGARFEFLGVEPAAETPDATADSGAESGQV
jgi:signal transduction histidine kinase